MGLCDCGAASARIAERQLSEFNAQDLANTAWACATVVQSELKRFAALARIAERRLREFNAWTFARQ